MVEKGDLEPRIVFRPATAPWRPRRPARSARTPSCFSSMEAERSIRTTMVCLLAGGLQRQPDTAGQTETPAVPRTPAAGPSSSHRITRRRRALCSSTIRKKRSVPSSTRFGRWRNTRWTMIGIAKAARAARKMFWTKDIAAVWYLTWTRLLDCGDSSPLLDSWMGTDKPSALPVVAKYPKAVTSHRTPLTKSSSPAARGNPAAPGPSGSSVVSSTRSTARLRHCDSSSRRHLPTSARYASRTPSACVSEHFAGLQVVELAVPFQRQVALPGVPQVKQDHLVLAETAGDRALS